MNRRTVNHQKSDTVGLYVFEIFQTAEWGGFLRRVLGGHLQFS
jgi:hypothetical protein